VKTKVVNLFAAIGVISTCVALLCLASLFLSQSAESDSTPTATPTMVIPTRTMRPTRTLSPTKTSTPILTATVTPTPTNTDTPTLTAFPTETTDARALYSEIQNRELSTYPDNHAGERVKVKGMVFNINSDSELQIFLGNSSDYPAYIVFDEPFQGIYEDEYITVYGVVYGETCGTNAFGGEICQPLIEADFYEK
jgi:hypothetical protein